MPVRVHRAAATGELADALGDLLSTPLPDPFEQEVVVVPAKGVERWLAQRLSHRLGAGPRGGDGVCAGVRFLTPHSLFALVTGIRSPADDPWHPDRSAWSLLGVIDDALGEDWCRALSVHLGDASAAPDLDEHTRAARRSRRWSVARRLAGLMDAYADQRPSLLAAWAAGQDTDGHAALPEDLRWQPELYRRLVAAVAERDGVPAPDVRHAALVRSLADRTAAGVDPHLPSRLSLFGHTRLSASEIDLLRALGEHREVHLWLPLASPALWDELRPVVGDAGPSPRIEDTTGERVAHRLLASLGRDTRELPRSLGPALTPEAPDASGDPAPDAAPPRSRLAWLQHDIRADREPDAAARAGRTLDPADRSIQVHACHGAARQVEVVREVLTGLLADDPTLEPRDIIVLCPDVDTFAPLVQAAFGLAQVAEDTDGNGHPGHRLRVTLADRAPTGTNPLLDLAVRLLDLSRARLTSTEVLDLLDTDVVRRRFRLSDDDLERLTRWVGDAGIRWGRDGAHRGEFGMGGIEENTWRSGLDRILSGVALDEQLADGDGALPLEDVQSTDVDLAGRLAELLDRLTTAFASFAEARTATEWARVLTDAVHGLGDVPPADAWQRAELDRELAWVARGGSGSAAGPDLAAVALGPLDLRRLLTGRWQGRPTRAGFRLGTITVCTMVPMRSVPHRVVCLLGLDDGVFPRHPAPDGDDVLARRPLTGERDLRSEDRQLLLDAVMSAGETLIATYTGFNEQSGSTRPPAVPLGEVLDAARAAAATPPGTDVLLHHPLQSADSRNFEPGALAPAGPFSFDGAGLRAVEAARHGPPPVAGGPADLLPADPTATQDLELEDLIAFFADPAKAFLVGRLGVTLPWEAEPPPDVVPIELDGLERWGVADRILAAVLAGRSPEQAMTAELQRGNLPPQQLGQSTLTGLVQDLRPVAEAALRVRTGDPGQPPIDVALPDGRRLVGAVPDVHGDVVTTAGFSRTKARSRLTTWIRVLALTATDPERAWRGSTVGRARRKRTAWVHEVPTPSVETARTVLADLVHLRDLGLRTLLPAPVETTAVIAEALYGARNQDDRARETDVGYAAGDAWAGRRLPSGDHIPGENESPSWSRLLGPASSARTLLDLRIRDTSGRSDLGVTSLARTIWFPLLDVETSEVRG